MTAQNLYEHLREKFQSIAGADSFNWSRSNKGTYRNAAKARDWKMFCAGVAVALESPTLIEKERDEVVRLNHEQWLALEDVRLLASRHRDVPWAKDMLRFCERASVAARTTRSADPPDTYPV